MEAPPIDVVAAAALDAALDLAAATPAPELKSFGKLGLPEAALRALDRAGMHRPFAIQTVVLPDAVAGRDILARAQTGSGKTLAFGLPLLARLHANPLGYGANHKGHIRAIALVPTRELARQVAEALIPLANPLGLTVGLVYGGAQIHKQIEKLNRGVDLLVATPGRLIDLMNRGAVHFDQVEATVLDEADYLADLGFLPALTTILDATPAGSQRMLFSATLDRGVALFVEKYLTDPAIHAIADGEQSARDLMTHKMFVMAGHEKQAIAAEIAARPARTLFFTKTKAGADELAAAMNRLGADAAAIHSDLNQRQRMKVLDAFTVGTTRVLVATDVAARGLHVSDVDVVVHFDPPHDHKDYLHRSGRTARAGAAGTVVSFVTGNQVRRTAKLQESAGVVVDKYNVAPGHEAVRALATSGKEIPPPPPPSKAERGRLERAGRINRSGPRPEHAHTPRRSEDSRPPRTEGYRPPRIEGARPLDGASYPSARREDSRPPRSFDDSRPARTENFPPARREDSRPPRTFDDSRAPRTEGYRPARSEDSRAPRRFEDSRPSRSEDSRPPRRFEDSRPSRGEDSRPARSFDDSRPARRDDDRRPARTEDSRPQRRSEDTRPARRFEGSRPGHRSDDSRSAHRGENPRSDRREDSRPSRRADAPAGKRKPRAEVAAKSAKRGTGAQSDPRTGATKSPHRKGAENQKPTKRSGPPQAQPAGNRAARRAHLQTNG
ncbi:MAG: DEAD/DEAH box helicase [Sporichthyaceae bacterium]